MGMLVDLQVAMKHNKGIQLIISYIFSEMCRPCSFTFWHDWRLDILYAKYVGVTKFFKMNSLIVSWEIVKWCHLSLVVLPIQITCRCSHLRKLMLINKMCMLSKMTIRWAAAIFLWIHSLGVEGEMHFWMHMYFLLHRKVCARMYCFSMLYPRHTIRSGTNVKIVIIVYFQDTSIYPFNYSRAASTWATAIWHINIVIGQYF